MSFRKIPSLLAKSSGDMGLEHAEDRSLSGGAEDVVALSDASRRSHRSQRMNSISSRDEDTTEDSSSSAAPQLSRRRTTLGSLWKLGMKVVVKTGKHAGVVGVVKFVDGVKFSKGKWVGLELETAEGKHDGTVQGVRYYQCKPNHGLFVNAALLASANEPAREEKSQTLDRATALRIRRQRRAHARSLTSGEIPERSMRSPTRQSMLKDTISSWQAKSLTKSRSHDRIRALSPANRASQRRAQAMKRSASMRPESASKAASRARRGQGNASGGQEGAGGSSLQEIRQRRSKATFYSLNAIPTGRPRPFNQRSRIEHPRRRTSSTHDTYRARDNASDVLDEISDGAEDLIIGDKLTVSQGLGLLRMHPWERSKLLAKRMKEAMQHIRNAEDAADMSTKPHSQGREEKQHSPSASQKPVRSDENLQGESPPTSAAPSPPSHSPDTSDNERDPVAAQGVLDIPSDVKPPLESPETTENSDSDDDFPVPKPTPRTPRTPRARLAPPAYVADGPEGTSERKQGLFSIPHEFGISLHEYPSKLVVGYEAPIPLFLTEMKTALRTSKAFAQEGVFRVGPSKEACARAMTQIETGTLETLPEGSILCELLKQWLSAIPQPLLSSLHAPSLTYVKTPEAATKVLNQLHEPQASVFIWLLDLLAESLEFRDKNRMSPKGLAITLAPNLFPKPPKDVNMSDISQEIMMMAMTQARISAEFLEQCILSRLMHRS